MLYFKIGGAEVHLMKLCGALIIFAAVLGILNASAVMWQSWGVLRSAKDCIGSNSDPFSAQKNVCVESVYKITGAYIGPYQDHIDTTQYWIALLGPLIILIIWAAVFVFGWMVYNLGKTFIPIEEAEKKLSEKLKHHRK